jgi:hypothetical protein
LAAWRARTATPAPRPKKRARRDARLAIRLRAVSGVADCRACPGVDRRG